MKKNSEEMMDIRTIFRAAPLLLMLSAGAFAAPVTIVFASSLISVGQGGQTVTFSANLTNTTGVTVFLNGDSLNIASPLIVDDTKFFLNAPLSLAAGASSGTIQIFDIRINPGTPFGLYPGNFTVLGGATPNDLDPLGTAPFAVNVVPEPATATMLLGALLAGAAFLRRRQ
jgi:hypothetical protein